MSTDDYEEDDKYHIAASSSLTASGTRVLKHGDTFAVFNRYGDVQATGLGEQGVYHDGTRFLSRLRLRLGQHRLLLLSSTVLKNNLLLAVDLTNPDVHARGELTVPYGTLHIFRSKFLWKGTCFERFNVSNYGERAIDIELNLEFDADFVDVFEVRGTRRDQRGEHLPPEVQADLVLLGYRGLDGLERKTRVEFAPRPDTCDDKRATFRVHLEAGQSKEIYSYVTCSYGDASKVPAPIYEHAYAAAYEVIRSADARDAHIYTSNEQFNDWINRSVADLRMMITETEQGPYPYAGVPWFSTAFGRDGILTAMQALWLNPTLSAGALRYLAAHQADRVDEPADAEPGKILHETRRGEMAALREIPFGKYYGSIDSTPLFLLLAAKYFQHSGDRQLLEDIWPNILRALEWIDTYGDVDGDGFVEYGRRAKDGLIQQGWKDSHDSVFHKDGSPAEGPIALCEVQGYVYAAKKGIGKVARQLGQVELADKLAREAQELQLRFDEAFWCEDLSMYALALDGRKRRCRVRSSNVGHCLFSEIALPHRAAHIADQLLSDEMFSGWGIRTLGKSEQRYNPMSYHNGSIWPHDNAIVAEGLARYGFKDAAARVLTALFDASLFVELHRLPELYCGFRRRGDQGPTLYPVACSPQAWASAAPFLLLKAILGLSVDAEARRISFYFPVLPPFLNEISIRGLTVGDASLDLRLHRYPEDVGINVTGRRGQVEVLAVK